jgi:hypothetical protein
MEHSQIESLACTRQEVLEQLYTMRHNMDHLLTTMKEDILINPTGAGAGAGAGVGAGILPPADPESFCIHVMDENTTPPSIDRAVLLSFTCKKAR